MDKKKPVQKMRYSDAELSLTKNTFAENEDLLKAIRKVFLQIPLDAVDKDVLKAHVVGKPDVLKLIRKSYLPEIDPSAPLHQVIDLWMTIEIKDKTPRDAWPHIVARDTLIKYLEQQLDVLETLDMDKGKIRLANAVGLQVTLEDAYINLMWRNTLIAHNEQQLAQFAVLAGNKEETVEQTKERLRRDSSK